MKTWVLMASGPSLTRDDVGQVRQSGCKTMVINRTWEIAPWADVLYAGDARWWRKYNPEERFNGEKYTLSATTAKRLGIGYVTASMQFGLQPPTVYAGGLSGIAAINLAYHLGADRIVLLGYDCCYSDNGKRHWHDDYNEQQGFPNVPHLHQQVENFNYVARSCPVPILNASRRTAITAFERVVLSEVLY